MKKFKKQALAMVLVFIFLVPLFLIGGVVTDVSATEPTWSIRFDEDWEGKISKLDGQTNPFDLVYDPSENALKITAWGDGDGMLWFDLDPEYHKKFKDGNLNYSVVTLKRTLSPSTMRRQIVDKRKKIWYTKRKLKKKGKVYHIWKTK